MFSEMLGITVLWIFLYGYLIVASIDFGAGFFNYYSVLSGKNHLIQGIIERYLSPVWEVTNVFLIFFTVGIVGFFPDIAYYMGSALLIPGSFAIVLLAVRGSYYAFNHYGPAVKHPWYMMVYGATGLLIPAALTIVLTLSEGGYIVQTPAGVQLQYRALFFSPYSWSVVLLAIVSVLYISAMFLTFYADRARDKKALEVVRGYALGWSAPTIIASLLVFFSIRHHNPQHYVRMLNHSWLYILSFACFLGAAALVKLRVRYGTAFVLVMFQFAFAFFGYGAAHLPYILYPYVTIKHFTSPAMAEALITAFIAGLFLLVPSLFLLMRLFLFNADYVQGKKH